MFIMHEMLFRCQLKYPNLHRQHRKYCKQFTSNGNLVSQTLWQAGVICFGFFYCECYKNVHICIFINIYILPSIKVHFVQCKMLTCLLRVINSFCRRWNSHVMVFILHLSHQLNSFKASFCIYFFFLFFFLLVLWHLYSPYFLSHLSYNKDYF